MKIPTPSNSTLEDIEERVKEDGDNQKELMFQTNQKKKSLLILLFLVVITYVFFEIGDSDSFANFIKNTERSLKITYKTRPVVFWLTVFVAQFGGSVTSIPTHVFTSIVTYYIVRNFLLCYVILCSISIFGTFVCYLIYIFFYDRVFKKMKNFPLTKILKARASKNPYLIAFISRCLLISSGFNDYLVLMCDISFHIYMVTGVIYHLITSALFLVIGYKISALRDVFNYEKWMKMSGRDKITLISSLLFILTTVVTLFYICLQLQKNCENEAKQFKTMLSEKEKKNKKQNGNESITKPIVSDK